MVRKDSIKNNLRMTHYYPSVNTVFRNKKSGVTHTYSLLSLLILVIVKHVVQDWGMFIINKNNGCIYKKHIILKVSVK